MRMSMEVSELLKHHAHANWGAIVRIEDAITARIIYCTENKIEGFVDAELVAQIVKDDRIVTKDADSLNLDINDKLIFFPVDEPPFTGVFILAVDEAINTEKDFSEFLWNAWVGLKDIAKLILTYFRAEQFTTRFNAILGTIQEGIVFVDDSGRDGWVNAPAAKLLGIPKDNNSSMAIAAAMQVLRSTAVNKDEIEMTGRLLFSSPNKSIKDWMWLIGDPVTCALSVACVPTISENIKGRLWVFTDITPIYLATEQLKELNTELAEKRAIAEEQNKAKSDFLANMSHEIRTPMNGVIGMASLLDTTSLNVEQKEYVDTIKVSGETLLTIINDILDLSKIESGKMELESHPFKVAKVIEETYDLLGVKANEKGLDLLYYIDPHVPSEIMGDITRFRQILVNLVSNAIKFTDTGEVCITANVIGMEDDMYTLEFAVKDTGIGIPKEKYYKLFSSFSQVDASTTRKYGGTGLGLAICQKLVALMGGAIRVESEYGKGSSFIFNIMAEANRKTIHYNAKEKLTPEVLKGKKILILDDNNTNLRILHKQCEMWGMMPAITTSDKEALELVRTNKFDIAIVDMLLPDTNGIEVGKQIKEIYPNLPLILFSSAGHLPMKNADVKQLFAAVLNKPIKHGQMEEALINVFSTNTGKVVNSSENTLANDALPIQILVAEDDPVNRKVIAQVLKKTGYSCDIVENGRLAVNSVNSKKYQLVFMDMMMPEMDGYEAARIISEEHPGNTKPIIVALTANAFTGEKDKILTTGMDDYLTKPYKVEDLKDVILKWKNELLERL